ncbi:MAG TPA: PaaI family thioesterase [Solirubrobacteraceae bacterium]|nr:PaaI family thioesterase [Solirubrobacteraceae bacterium]
MDDAEPTAAPPRGRDEEAPWRGPVRGGHPDPALAARAGIEFLDALLAGETPAPPLARLTGMAPVTLRSDCARYTMPLSPWLCDDDGRIPLGVMAIPADAAMACAIIAGLPAQTTITTSELGLRQVRPARPGGVLVTTASVVDLTPTHPTVALAEVTVTDDAGTLIARGGSLCVILRFDGDGDGGNADGTQDADGAADADADEPATTAAGPDPWERRSPGAGLSRLTGLETRAVAANEAVVALPATRWLCAPPPGRVQGGAVAMLAGAAIDAAMQTAAPAGHRFTPVELKLNYLRPLASDGREATGHATLVHGGRRTAVARAEVSDADGRAIAVASGSAIAEPLAR